MNYNPNRLQFVHCDTCFENSSKAREYVNGELISNKRPALYAEPMVLKYGNPSNPNILLAIGSVGDGKTQTVDNKVFFIDFAQLDIDNNFNFLNTNTVSFQIKKNEYGTDVKSNVLLQPSKIVDKYQYDNIILNEEQGLFSYVNVEIVNNELIVCVNGEKQIYELPDTIVSGNFNAETFELTLNTRKNKSHVIPLHIISNNDNNIIKKYKDGLYANVNLKYDKSEGILSFNNGLEEQNFNLLSSKQENINNNVEKELIRLNLSTTNSNTIQYIYQKTDEGTNISSNVKLKQDIGNILLETENGLLATVDLGYDKENNILTLKTTNGQKDIPLSNHTLVNSISYDSENKKIIFIVNTAVNGKETFEIPLSDLFNEWDVENNPTSSPIILEKTIAEGNGYDILKAHLNVSSSNDNLIQIKSNGSTANLFASNQADAIKAKWYSVDEHGDVIVDKEVENVQQAIIKIVNFFDDTTKMNNHLYDRIIENEEATALVLDEIKKDINTISKEIDDLINEVNNLTDFGYTD